jgi:hypothetical protein
MKPIRSLASMLVAFAIAGSALAQTTAPYEPPRLADGRPDLQGEWSYQFLTPVEKALGNDLVVSPQRAAQLVDLIRKMAKVIGEAALDPEAADPDSHSLAIVRGENRTRQIVAPADGLLPFTPEAAKQAAARMALFRQQISGRHGDGPEERLTWERCLAGMGQAPLMTSWAINMVRQIVQTPKDLVVWSEAGGETRIVHIGGAPLPTAMRSFLGDSVGRWDGDTLVVETTGFRSDDAYRLSVGVGRPILVGPDSKVVERFSRIADGELLYQFTVEDPAIYAKPWLAEYSMKRTSEPMYEFACHEGNYSLPGILKGARMGEKRAAQAASTPAVPAKP